MSRLECINENHFDIKDRDILAEKILFEIIKIKHGKPPIVETIDIDPYEHDYIKNVEDSFFYANEFIRRKGDPIKFKK